MAKSKSPKIVVKKPGRILTKSEKINKDVYDNRSEQLDHKNHRYFLSRGLKVPIGSK